MFNEKSQKHKVAGKFIIEIILITMIFIIALVLYWGITTTEFEDPIETTKNNFLTIQLQLIGISVIATAIVIVFTRNKIKLIRNLTIVAVISTIMIITQVGVKIYLDNKYQQEEFEQLYEIHKENDDKYYKDISISFSGVNIIGAKESYIKKSISSYNIFKIKTIMFIIIHLLIVILILYKINKLTIDETNKANIVKNEIFYGKE